MSAQGFKSCKGRRSRRHKVNSAKEAYEAMRENTIVLEFGIPSAAAAAVLGGSEDDDVGPGGEEKRLMEELMNNRAEAAEHRRRVQWERMEEQDIRAACLREAEDHDFFTKVRAAATARSEQMEWRRQQARSCRDEREREREKSLRPKGGELTALEVRLWKEHEEEWDKLAKRLQSMSQILSHHIPWPPAEENIITSTARTVNGVALELSPSSWKSETKKVYRRAVTRWHPECIDERLGADKFEQLFGDRIPDSQKKYVFDRVKGIAQVERNTMTRKRRSSNLSSRIRGRA